MTEQEYVEERIEDQIEWYNGKSMVFKKYYEWITYATISIGSIASILLVTTYMWPNNAKCITFLELILTAAVPILVGIDKTKQYQKTSILYRGVCEKLKQEKFLFATKTGEYKNDDRFQIFVERCESIIATENQNWAQLNEKSKN